MTNLNSPPKPKKNSSPASTEAEAKSIHGRAGKTAKSSKNAKSHTKANSQEGAGGGKKQQRHH